MANARLDWLIIQRGDANGVFTSLQDLYAVSTQAQILGLMQRIINGIQNPTRGIPAPGSDAARTDATRVQELTYILESITALCAPDGARFTTPPPAQHILRVPNGNNAVVARDALHYTTNRRLWGYWSGFPQGQRTGGEIRWNWYWALTDLVGLFLTKLGPAPPWAQERNFYLPLTAVFVRWVICLVDDATCQPPSKYQCTWIRRDPSVPGQLDEFSLGASFGGNLQTAPPAFRTDLQRARFGLLDRDPFIRNATWRIPGRPRPERWGFNCTTPNGQWRFGNCAETYPLILQHLITTTQARKDRTHGFAMEPRAASLGNNNQFLNYDEARMLRTVPRAQGREYINIAAPCENCTFMINHHQAILAQFTPTIVFPLPPVQPRG